MVKVGKATLLFPIFFALLSISNYSVAQKIEIGGGIGATSSKGDIIPSFGLSTSLPAAQVFLRQNFSPSLVLKYNVMFGGLRANGNNARDVYTSRYSDSLNLSFRTFILEASVQGEYNFFDYRAEKRRRWTPYIFAGAGAFLFSPNVENEAVKKPFIVQPAIPFGIGAKMILYKQWNLGLEMGARKTFTDFLDNASDEDINTGLQRGNRYNKDMYFFTGITLSYTIYKIVCPYDTY